MRCYNMKCSKWKKAESECDCAFRIATRPAAERKNLTKPKTVRVAQRGGSLAIIIPVALLNETDISLGDRLRVTAQHGALVYEKD